MVIIYSLQQSNRKKSNGYEKKLQMCKKGRTTSLRKKPIRVFKPFLII